MSSNFYLLTTFLNKLELYLIQFVQIINLAIAIYKTHTKPSLYI